MIQIIETQAVSAHTARAIDALDGIQDDDPDFDGCFSAGLAAARREALDLIGQAKAAIDRAQRHQRQEQHQ